MFGYKLGLEGGFNESTWNGSARFTGAARTRARTRACSCSGWQVDRRKLAIAIAVA